MYITSTSLYNTARLRRKYIFLRDEQKEGVCMRLNTSFVNKARQADRKKYLLTYTKFSIHKDKEVNSNADV
jgi:hypothetical protein